MNTAKRRALLVDDERLARQELRRLLSVHPEIEVVGEAPDAEAARARVKELGPDLLFLDVQMPGEDGFQLLESLESAVPAVIFTTAYDEFAVKAFEFNALDYLMKPVDPARLAAALARLAERPSAPGATEGTAAAAERGRSSRLAPEDRVFVREGDRCWFVEVKSIRLLESEGNYTRVHFDGAQPLLFRSLNAMEARLDPRVFFRANRRQIINLEWIDKIEPWFSGGLLVGLKGGPNVELSRRQAQAFRERMSL
jgi:two-component system LytT family response regulator